MRCVRFVAAAALVLVGGCSDPTPAGTVLLEHDLTGELPEGLSDRLGAPELHTTTATLASGGRLEIRYEVATTDDGGRYLTRMAVEVADAEGWKLDARAAGPAPFNVGPGPGPEVVMARPIMIAQSRKKLTGHERRQIMVVIRADGTVQLP